MHISELAERHVEIPEQVVQVNDDIFVKVIDIDLERRRISLSLKQANEGAGTQAEGEGDAESFDPTLYGMSANYDAEGNYQYPDGFDPDTNEWLPGHEEAQAEWERQYGVARTRFEAHKKQVEEAKAAEAEAGTADASGPAISSYSSDAPEEEDAGTLASDEALAALREKLTGGSDSES